MHMRKWLLITFILLALMAILSALGEFFVRIFLVGALFSGWKIIQSWLDLRTVDRNSTHETFSKGAPGKSREVSSEFSAPGKSLLHTIQSWPLHTKITAGIWAFAIFIFILILSVVVLSPDDSQADFYYTAANQFYDQQQYDSAYVNYKKALSMRPDYPDAMFGYGNVLYTRNYPDSSIYYYEKALEANPDFEDAKYNKAWVYFQQMKYDQSIEELEILLDDNDSYFVGMQLMGDNYYAKNQYDDALNWYDQAYSNGIRSGFFCERMAYIYDTRNDREKAVELYREAISFDNSLKESFRRLGELVPGEEGAAFREKAYELQ